MKLEDEMSARAAASFMLGVALLITVLSLSIVGACTIIAVVMGV